MVYYFHTIYARDDLKYLVKVYPNYELYDGCPLRENDVLVVAVYLNLLAMAEFANLADMLQKDVRTYGSSYEELFRFIDLNIDNYAVHSVLVAPSATSRAAVPNVPAANSLHAVSVQKGKFILRGEDGMKEYIWHPQVVSLLKLPQSKLLLYNSWETKDLYKCIPVIRHYCNYHSIPTSKLLLSMTDHQQMFKKYPAPRVISYDWQYIHAKMKFSREKTVDQQTPKSKHLICFNSRSNDERLAAVAYLYTKHREKCHLSFLNNKRSAPIDDKMLSHVKHFISPHKFLSFKNAIPLSLERGLPRSIADAYILLMFETNIIRHGCQQISEKTYRPIIAGIPFLLWGSQGGILAHLKKMGFQTFTPHINEEYDNPKYSYMERYVRLINEVERLCSLDTDEIDSLYRQCLPMVEHNFTVLESRENIPPLL